MQREAADGAEIRRDVVAPFAVPSSGSQDNFTFFITKADGDAVNLGFDRPIEFCIGQEFMDPPDKISYFGLGVGVVKAHHANRMPDGDEFAQGGTADSLSRGFRGHELRKGRFEFDEFLIKPVVFPVRNGGVRQNVIGVVVSSDLFGKLPVFSFSVLGIHALASNRAQRNAARLSKGSSAPHLRTSLFLHLASLNVKRNKWELKRRHLGAQTAGIRTGNEEIVAHVVERLPLNKLAGKTSDLAIIQHGESP